MSDRRGGFAAVLAFSFCALAAVVAGCSEEGKLIDVPLATRAVAYDQLNVVDTSATTVAFTARFKVLVHAANPCEARHVLLELSRTGPTSTPTYVIKPVARYNADDAGVNLPAGESDTTITLTVNSLVIANQGAYPFEVVSAGGPLFALSVDSTMHAPVASTIRFQVKVEDRLTASPVAGATVALDSLTVGGGVAPISSTTSDGGGLATFDVASTAAVGVESVRYQVTVTSGSNTVVMPVRAAPARGQSRERIFVRI